MPKTRAKPEVKGVPPGDANTLSYACNYYSHRYSRIVNLMTTYSVEDGWHVNASFIDSVIIPRLVRVATKKNDKRVLRWCEKLKGIFAQKRYVEYCEFYHEKKPEDEPNFFVDAVAWRHYPKEEYYDSRDIKPGR